jgi:hypothetical protein
MHGPQLSKVRRIGFMTNGVRGADFEALREGFARLGYVEGQNIIFEPRFAKHQLNLVDTPRLLPILSVSTWTSF